MVKECECLNKSQGLALHTSITIEKSPERSHIYIHTYTGVFVHNYSYEHPKTSI